MARKLRVGFVGLGRVFDGGSHVSVQKPMAMTLPECDRMIEAAAASGRRLKVFENFVFYPPLVRARELLRDGAIGRPLHFRMKVVMADRAQAWRVPDAASHWRHVTRCLRK